MILSNVVLKGFRNFKDSTINLKEKSLIIGANEIGKTNLIWALRLLLDKSLSDFDRDPKDSDFYVYEETNQFEIQLKFSEITEDCILTHSGLRGRISDNDEIFLVHRAYRKNSGAKTYSLLAGCSLDHLEEIDGHACRSVLNLKYISSRRDFNRYVNREKNNLFLEAKENRTENEIEQDRLREREIETNLKIVDESIPKLSFIAQATKSINAELEKLSIRHTEQTIVFDATCSSIDKFINNVSIASKSKEKPLAVGGDGRLNQIFLCLWAARNEITDYNLEEVSIICIEEPEAHLHPHQQRKLAEYLGKRIAGQVLITTHSPQIACEYSPNSIVRLLNKGEGTVAASNGCSDVIDKSFNDFGYRMSVIPAEAFFADVVFLVEGSSEELFYKGLARQLQVDLDRLNISILMVDGIGFQHFTTILDALEIKWALRTDNDISQIPHKKDKYQMAGLRRLFNCYKNSSNRSSEITQRITDCEKLLTDLPDRNLPPESVKSIEEVVKLLNKTGFFISKTDLEGDLFNSEIRDDLVTFYDNLDETKILFEMRKKKATSMYEFLKTNKESLQKLKSDSLALPLYYCKEIAESYYR